MMNVEQSVEWELAGEPTSRRKPAPVPLCPPQIPPDLPWTRTRAASVGSRRLTAWAMARPSPFVTLLYAVYMRKLLQYNTKMDLMENGCEDRRCVKLGQDRVHRRPLLLAVLNIWVLLPECLLRHLFVTNVVERCQLKVPPTCCSVHDPRKLSARLRTKRNVSALFSVPSYLTCLWGP
jgi:hypothetical protein